MGMVSSPSSRPPFMLTALAQHHHSRPVDHYREHIHTRVVAASPYCGLDHSVCSHVWAVHRCARLYFSSFVIPHEFLGAFVTLLPAYIYTISPLPVYGARLGK